MIMKEENIDDQILKDEDDIIDGNDIENNRRQNIWRIFSLDMTNIEKKVWLVRLPLFLAQKWKVWQLKKVKI